VDVGPAPELPNTFYTFWYGPDPIDPSQRVCDTHLPPTLRPEYVTHIETKERQPFNLHVLAQLVQNPGPGERRTQFRAGLIENLIGETPARPAAWLIMRRGVLGRGHYFEILQEPIFALNVRTRAGYEVEPSVIDLSTVIFARYVDTGERHLGDETGAEGRPTSCFTAMQGKSSLGTTHRVSLGNFSPPGSQGSCGLDYLMTVNRDENVGVALLILFTA
jgi:hypothetical protein